MNQAIGLEAFMEAKRDSLLSNQPHTFEAEVPQHQGEDFLINKAVKTCVILKEVCSPAV
jgi:hypothetical protein